MNPYLLLDYIIQHGFNALAGFLLFSLLIELCMKIFQIRNYRLRAFFRLLPPLRLILEPLFWYMSPVLVNINIFSCSHPFQRFLFRQLSEASQQEMGLYGLKTVIGSLLLKLPSFTILGFIAALSAISLYKMATLIMQYAASYIQLKGIRKRAVCCCRPIHNKKLLSQLQYWGIQVVSSSEVDVPLAGPGKTIIIAKNLYEQLSQTEFETVLSHELEHHRYKDSFAKMICHIAAALYWWIPMKTWFDKIVKEQELACDVSVHRYQLSGLDLAEALKKTVQQKKMRRFLCSAFTENHQLFVRIRVMLKPLTKQNKFYAATGFAMILGFFLILGFAIC